jgi:hypothetical protein
VLALPQNSISPSEGVSGFVKVQPIPEPCGSSAGWVVQSQEHEVDVTIKVNEVLLGTPPPKPFTMTVYVPAGVDDDVVIGRVAVQTLFGVQLAEPHDAPEGSPEQLNDTDDAVPLVFVIVTDDDALDPDVTETGEADIE